MTKRRNLEDAISNTGNGNMPNAFPAPKINMPVPRRAAQAIQASDKAIMIQNDGTMQIAGCVMSGAGLDVPSNITEEDLRQVTEVLLRMEDRLQLYIGDALVAAENLGYGSITSLAERMGRQPKTLWNWKTVCANVRTALRRAVLAKYPHSKTPTISHYEIIMGLPEEEQSDWLEKLLQNDWSVMQFRTEVAGKSLGDGTRITKEERYHNTLSEYKSWLLRQNKKQRRAEVTMLRALLDELEESL